MIYIHFHLCRDTNTTKHFYKSNIIRITKNMYSGLKYTLDTSLHIFSSNFLSIKTQMVIQEYRNQKFHVQITRSIVMKCINFASFLHTLGNKYKNDLPLSMSKGNHIHIFLYNGFRHNCK